MSDPSEWARTMAEALVGATAPFNQCADVASALAAAERRGAEQMRERCATWLREQADRCASNSMRCAEETGDDVDETALAWNDESALYNVAQRAISAMPLEAK